MSAIYFLIPLGLFLLAMAIAAFVWAVKKNQFTDLDSAGHSILMEEETPPANNKPAE